MISRFSKAFLAILLALFLLTTIAFIHPPSRAYVDPWTGDLFGEGGVELPGGLLKGSPPPGAKGDVIMPKLGNATAKAELGRATWKLLHTMTLRYPESPTQDQKDALASYFHLLSRLYPCGECAAEFQELLKKFPPQATYHLCSLSRTSANDLQTSSRRAAATWLCVVHNQVNERLKKPEFDCAHLDATYDCGCGDDPVTPVAPDRGVHDDPMDPVGLQHEPVKDDKTGAGLIRGG